MHAARHDSFDELPPGRPVARLEAGHPALDRGDDAYVTDDVTDWADDLDLSLDADAAHPVSRPGRSPLLVALVAVAFLMMLGLGLIGAVVLGGAVAAVAMLLFVPRLAGPPELPVRVESPPIEIVAPAPVSPTAPVAVPTLRPAPVAKPAQPTPPPVGESTPAPAPIESEMVIMPDPGFRATPVDKAIRQLHERAGSGEIGSIGGRR